MWAFGGHMLNSVLQACKVSAVLLELCFQFIIALALLGIVSHKLFAQAGLKLRSQNGTPGWKFESLCQPLVYIELEKL
jgi:hypothetical protein